MVIGDDGESTGDLQLHCPGIIHIPLAEHSALCRPQQRLLAPMFVRPCRSRRGRAIHGRDRPEDEQDGRRDQDEAARRLAAVPTGDAGDGRGVVHCCRRPCNRLGLLLSRFPSCVFFRCLWLSVVVVVRRRRAFRRGYRPGVSFALQPLSFFLLR